MESNLNGFPEVQGDQTEFMKAAISVHFLNLLREKATTLGIEQSKVTEWNNVELNLNCYPEVLGDQTEFMKAAISVHFLNLLREKATTLGIDTSNITKKVWGKRQPTPLSATDVSNWYNDSFATTCSHCGTEVVRVWNNSTLNLFQCDPCRKKNLEEDMFPKYLFRLDEPFLIFQNYSNLKTAHLFFISRNSNQWATVNQSLFPALQQKAIIEIRKNFKRKLNLKTWGFFQTGSSQLVGFQHATTPVYVKRVSQNGKPPMPYASMMLQIIRALEEDKSGFFFLIFNHEDQLPCKPVDLEFLLNFLKKVGMDLKKFFFLRIELADPKMNYHFDANQLAVAISSKINPFDGHTVIHQFLQVLANSYKARVHPVGLKRVVVPKSSQLLPPIPRVVSNFLDEQKFECPVCELMLSDGNLLNFHLNNDCSGAVHGSA